MSFSSLLLILILGVQAFAIDCAKIKSAYATKSIQPLNYESTIRKWSQRKWDAEKTDQAKELLNVKNNWDFNIYSLRDVLNLVRDGANPNAIFYSFWGRFTQNWNISGTSVPTRADWIYALRVLVQHGLNEHQKGLIDPVTYSVHLQSLELFELFTQTGFTTHLAWRGYKPDTGYLFGIDILEFAKISKVSPEMMNSIQTVFPHPLSPTQTKKFIEMILELISGRYNPADASKEFAEQFRLGADPNSISEMGQKSIPLVDILDRIDQRHRPAVLLMFLQHQRYVLLEQRMNLSLNQLLDRSKVYEARGQMVEANFYLNSARLIAVLGLKSLRIDFADPFLAQILVNLGLDARKSLTQLENEIIAQL